jgi:hypothetical protein
VTRPLLNLQMQLSPGRGLAVDLVKEADEFLMPVARHALADDLALNAAPCFLRVCFMSCSRPLGAS